LPPSHQIPDTLKPLDQDQYRVVIGIIGGPATSQKLPFFSRVTLKNSYKHLRAYGYRVAVSHIPLEENFARLAVLRERVKRQGRVKVSRPTPPTIGGIVAPVPPSRRIGR
jgi:hypothetical protein